jgi:hypothetical protein
VSADVPLVAACVVDALGVLGAAAVVVPLGCAGAACVDAGDDG